MRGHCAIRKIQRKKAIRHKHRTAFFVLQSARGRSMSVCSTPSRERVKGRSPLRSPEAAPLAGVRGSAPRSPSSTRGRSMRARSTPSRERVKGRSPLRSPEAAPLAGVRGSAPRSPSSTRGRSMRARSTPSRERVKGRSPLRSPEERLWRGLGAKPLGSPFTPKSSQSPLFPRLSAAHASAPSPRFGESARGGLRR